MKQFRRIVNRNAPKKCRATTGLKKLLDTLIKYHGKAPDPIYRSALNELRAVLGYVCGTCSTKDRLFDTVLDPFVEFLMRSQNLPEVSVCSRSSSSAPAVRMPSPTSNTSESGLFLVGRASFNKSIRSAEIRRIVDAKSNGFRAKEVLMDLRVLRVFNINLFGIEELPGANASGEQAMGLLDQNPIVQKIRDANLNSTKVVFYQDNELIKLLAQCVSLLKLAYTLNGTPVRANEVVPALVKLLELSRGEIYSEHQLSPDSLFKPPNPLDDTKLHSHFLAKTREMFAAVGGAVSRGETHIIETLERWVQFA